MLENKSQNEITTAIQSPLGLIEITGDDEFVSRISFFQTPDIDYKTNDLLETCSSQLKSYFNRQLKTFSFPIKQTGTDFQQKVWENLLEIPYGKTSSYLSIAEKLNDKKSVRAVGTANGQNNIAIVVPCHRVIGSNGSLTGYAGELWRKQWLLEHEKKVNGEMLDLF